MELNVQEILELEGLKWEVRDLRMKIEQFNGLRKALVEERKELLKKIDETERRYASSQTEL